MTPVICPICAPVCRSRCCVARRNNRQRCASCRLGLRPLPVRGLAQMRRAHDELVVAHCASSISSSYGRRRYVAERRCRRQAVIKNKRNRVSQLLIWQFARTGELDTCKCANYSSVEKKANELYVTSVLTLCCGIKTPVFASFKFTYLSEKAFLHHNAIRVPYPTIFLHQQFCH